MPSIGKVIVRPRKPIGTVHVKENQQTVISRPSVSSDIYMSDILDVDVSNVEDGDILVYNSDNSKYEATPLANVDVTVKQVSGGTF